MRKKKFDVLIWDAKKGPRIRPASRVRVNPNNKSTFYGLCNPFTGVVGKKIDGKWQLWRIQKHYDRLNLSLGIFEVEPQFSHDEFVDWTMWHLDRSAPTLDYVYIKHQMWVGNGEIKTDMPAAPDMRMAIFIFDIYSGGKSYYGGDLIAGSTDVTRDFVRTNPMMAGKFSSNYGQGAVGKLIAHRELGRDCQDILMPDHDGNLGEYTSAAWIGALDTGELITPPADACLASITADDFLTVVGPHFGYKCHRRHVSVAEWQEWLEHGRLEAVWAGGTASAGTPLGEFRFGNHWQRYGVVGGKTYKIPTARAREMQTFYKCLRTGEVIL